MRHHLTLMASASLAFAGHVQAQAVATAPAVIPASNIPAPTTPAKDADAPVEIIVTAQFRSERLQNVPIAITAVTASALANSGIRSTDDIAVAVPGLNISRQTGASLVFLRGVGTAGGQAAQEGAVATFVDGVYQPSPSAATMSLNNIERVEVVKGPQGTLYGRNATGGAINIITLTPSHTPEVRGEIGYGNKDTLEGTIYGTTGLGAKAAIDIAAYYRDQHDGFGKNITTGNDINKGKDFDIRSKLLLEPAEGTRIVIAGDYEYYIGSEALAQRATDTSSLLNGQIGYHGGFYDADLSFDPLLTSRGGGGSMTVDQEIGTLKLTSITAFRTLEVKTHTDSDGTPISILDVTLDEKNDQFTQELRLAGEAGKLQWIVGAFYLYGHSGYDPFEIGGLAVQAEGLNAEIINRSFQYTRSIAGFGQATYHVDDATRLTAGFRYTSDQRRYHGELTGDVIGVGVVPLAPANAFDAERTFAKPSWRLSIDHNFTSDLMAYASYNRGFKSGIYNVTAPGAAPVLPEQLDAYEVGLKTTLANGRAHINGAAYYYDYKNIQLISQVGAAQLLLNAAAATIYGAEIQFDAKVDRHLTLRGGLAYTHGRYGDFPQAPFYTPNFAPPFGNTITAGQGKGNSVVFTPDFTGSISADYNVPIGDSKIAANLTYAYNDGFTFTPDNSLRQPAYSLVNTQLTWFAPKDRFNVRIWARNLLAAKYLVSGLQGQVGNTVVAGTGRTFGVSFGFSL